MAQTWVRSGVLSGVADLMHEMGADPQLLAEQVGLDVRALHEPDLPITAASVVGLLELAAQHTGREDFGLQLAQRQNLSILGPLWMTMRTAQTVRQALELLANFFVVHTNGALVSLERVTGAGMWVCYSTSAGVGGADRQTMELGLALLCQELRTHCGMQWQPGSVHFCHAPPLSMVAHGRVFGKAVHFNADRNAVWLDEATLHVPLTAHAAPTHAMLTRLLVGRLDSAQVVMTKVESTLRALMPFSPCRRETVAHMVHLSERSMQRRLAQAGTTFDALRDAVRADIAMKYLTQSSLQLSQISDILGYAQPSVFSRAFKRQYGRSPRAVRETG